MICCPFAWPWPAPGPRRKWRRCRHAPRPPGSQAGAGSRSSRPWGSRRHPAAPPGCESGWWTQGHADLLALEVGHALHARTLAGHQGLGFVDVVEDPEHLDVDTLRDGCGKGRGAGLTDLDGARSQSPGHFGAAAQLAVAHLVARAFLHLLGLLRIAPGQHHVLVADDHFAGLGLGGGAAQHAGSQQGQGREGMKGVAACAHGLSFCVWSRTGCVELERERSSLEMKATFACAAFVRAYAQNAEDRPALMRTDQGRACANLLWPAPAWPLWSATSAISNYFDSVLHG